MRKSSKRWFGVIGVALALTMVATACGSSDGTDGNSASPPTTAATKAKLVTGCKNGFTEQDDMSLTRTVARCEPNTPAPVPLAQPAKVKIASAFKLEFNSPILLADSLGEFKKENLEVETVSLRFADAVPQLASGQVDVAVGGFEISLFNGGNLGLPVKAVMGNYFPPKAGDYSVPQTGLWCRRDAFTNSQDPDLKETEKLRWASSVGKGSVSVYYSIAEIQKKVPDFNIKNLNVQQIPSADTVVALKNKAIDCGVLLDPLWLQVKDDPNYFMAATQTPGEPLGIYAMGKSLLQDKPEVGVAFTRAVIRTINTYFAGDYHQDSKVMAEISKVTGQPVDGLSRTPSLTMDWEIREGTTTRIQRTFIDLGVITDFKEPVPESRIVDRTPYMKAVGAA